MEELIRGSLITAMARMQEHVALVELSNVDESTFRSFLLAEIKKRAPLAQCQTEWQRFDLLVQSGGCNAIVELKFYMTRPMNSLNGKHLRWKGWASPENEADFQKCVQKLRGTRIVGIDCKFIVLVFEASTSRKSKYTFTKSYEDLGRFNVLREIPVEHGFAEHLMCKFAQIE